MLKHTTTTRLTLDVINSDDHDFVLNLLNTKGWLEFIGDRNVHSKEAAVNYIRKILNTKNLWYWVVRIKEDNTPIGIISFLKRDYLEHFDIGFAFLPEYSGKGYAYEASKKIYDIAKAEYQPILATTIPENVNSIKLLEKLGFHFEKEIEVNNAMLHVYSDAIASI